MQECGARTAAPDSHRERVGDELGCHRRMHRPADSTSGIQIEHHRHVEPALMCPDVSKVSDPFLIRRGRRELPIQHIRRECMERPLTPVHWQRSLAWPRLEVPGFASAAQSGAGHRHSRLPEYREGHGVPHRSDHSIQSLIAPQPRLRHPSKHEHSAAARAMRRTQPARPRAPRTPASPARSLGVSPRSRISHRLLREVGRGGFNRLLQHSGKASLRVC